MKYIIEQISVSEEVIVEELLNDIKMIQNNDTQVDIQPLKDEIESYNLKKQTEYYDTEILKLTEQIARSQDINATHKNQLDSIKEYISKVKETALCDSNSIQVYGEMLKKVVVLEDQTADFYLTCTPFGFRIKYHVKKFNQQHRFNVFIDSCEVID